MTAWKSVKKASELVLEGITTEIELRDGCVAGVTTHAGFSAATLALIAKLRDVQTSPELAEFNRLADQIARGVMS